MTSKPPVSMATGFPPTDRSSPIYGINSYFVSMVTDFAWSQRNSVSGCLRKCGNKRDTEQQKTYIIFCFMRCVTIDYRLYYLSPFCRVLRPTSMYLKQAMFPQQACTLLQLFCSYYYDIYNVLPAVCAASCMAVFCSSMISCFPCMLLSYFQLPLLLLVSLLFLHCTCAVCLL